jgi:hypothetical protein
MERYILAVPPLDPERKSGALGRYAVGSRCDGLPGIAPVLAHC